ncbi:MAG: hypothetical protein HW401_765 [Parcubacteria group bacterium]|nr:hypothetical protein [Parcubacteria group bacterium]
MGKRLLIAAKYFVGKYKGISNITDYLELVERRLFSCPSNSKLERQILIKMVQLNKLQLPKITNYHELEFRLWKTMQTKSGSISEAKRQIENRMKKLNNTCSDYGEMLKRLKGSDNSSLTRQIKKRLYDLNDIQLLRITDYNTLTERLNDFNLDSKIIKQIELRIYDLNESCSDYNELAKRWRESKYRLEKFRKQIEERIIKILKEEKVLIQLFLEKKENLLYFLKNKLKDTAEEIIGG